MREAFELRQTLVVVKQISWNTKLQDAPEQDGFLGVSAATATLLGLVLRSSRSFPHPIQLLLEEGAVRPRARFGLLRVRRNLDKRRDSQRDGSDPHHHLPQGEASCRPTRADSCWHFVLNAAHVQALFHHSICARLERWRRASRSARERPHQFGLRTMESGVTGSRLL